ncbi:MULTISPECIES: hypothetical protein [unclassified Bradyrhizobium]|uniref:hypothetical protein n=1 Tax=unclassified Bradyrhizobium TaxID=2631580 RepID=UPI0015CD5CA9|nr:MULTISPECIES: hypothetical protein [unclassified Bradyrhizobium]MBB4261412.1 hypothetical protein [Bradyrhizobium sp. CIR3A]NYG47662.1 hypothetical protein [Bradyrhizobium sp. IAR9]
MVKASGKTNAIHWIWLNEALQEATRVLGSKRLTRKRLNQWMATGELPWSCMSLDLLDGKGQVMTGLQLGNAFLLLELFWDATSHWIDWEDNCAGENELGALQAMGISVSREHLFALLPQRREPSAGEKQIDGKEVGPQQGGEPKENQKRANKSRVSRQQLRVQEALKEIYPPDGKVTDEIPTSFVLGRVAHKLSSGTENRGLAAPSWDTVNRALGRGA